jgi:alpha-glucoside transport system substrate-binding protein
MNKRRYFVWLITVVLLALIVIAPATAQNDVKVVSLLTTFGGSELDALRVSLDAFTEQTGILVTVESNRNSTEVLRVRVAGGSPPDVALIPRPGFLAELARNGDGFPLVNADGSAGLIDHSVFTDN